MDGWKSWRPGDPDPDAAAEISRHFRVIAPESQKPKINGNWLIKGLIPKAGIGAIYGPSGCGKTFVALDIGMAVARGVPWCGRKTERRAVLYLCPDGGEMVQNRIEAYKLRCGGEIDHDLFLAPDAIDLLNRGRADAVAETIRTIEAGYSVRIGVVIIDTASRVMPGGDENAAKDVTRLIDNLALIGEGRAAIVIHHTPKSDATMLRGHSALHGACDFEINVADRTMIVAKQRDGASGEKFGFDLEVVEIGTDEDGDPVTSCVVVTADVTQCHAKGPKLTDDDRVGLRTIQNLIAEHGEPLPQGTGFPTHGGYLGVTSAAVTASLRGSIFADRTPAAARQSACRLRTRLQSLGLIGVNGGYVWTPAARGSVTCVTAARHAPWHAPTSLDQAARIPRAPKTPGKPPLLATATCVTCVT